MSNRGKRPAHSPGSKKAGSGASGVLQRACACGQHTGVGGECEHCKKERDILQRRSLDSSNPSAAPPIVHEALRSPGQNLDAGARSFFEPRFGQSSHASNSLPAGRGGELTIGRSDDVLESAADSTAERVVHGPDIPASGSGANFARVQVHTDAKAAEAAQAVNARAFTVGQHLVFNAGEYQPHTATGQELLAHELTHVVQQQGAEATPSPEVVQRKGGTAGGFFRNIGRAIADFFTGSEPDYDEQTLRDYLKLIDESNDIEDDYDSDNKARAIVHKDMFKGAELRIRVLLIREMITGVVGDEDEQAILTILEAATKEERETIATRIGLEKFYSKFDGEELDRLYVLYPILESLHPRGKQEVKTYTVDQYIDKWEKERGRIMTPAEKKTLARGCIGITALNLGTLGNPDLSNCYDTFAQAYETQQKMKDFLAIHFPDRKALIFSKRFWSGGKDFPPDPNTGKVDMSEPTEAKPGFVNFDYGLYDEKTGKWWHANHCDTTLLSNPQCGGDMEIYESNLKQYSRPLLDFDRQVFCVGVAKS